MRIDSLVDDGGVIVDVELVTQNDSIELRWAGEALASFPPAVIERVVRRYARPLEQGLLEDGGPELYLAQIRLRSWLYRAPVDLESKHYLVLDEEGSEPLAVLSRQVVNALRFVAERQAP